MSEIITIKGTVEGVLPLQEFASGFTKQVLVINVSHAKFPTVIPVEFAKEKTAMLNGLKEGEQVTAFINIRGNEYNGKYYASIQGWKLERGEAKKTESQEDEDEDGEIPF